MKIAVFGHSYVRDIQCLENSDHIYVDGAPFNLKYFSFPGYCFRNFLSDPKLLVNLVAFSPDIVVVILGGNGVNIDSDLGVLKSDCENFYVLLKSKLPQAYVIATQIEHRHLYSVNRHGTPTADLYKKLANNFNKWLIRQPFKDKILMVNGENKLGNSKFFRSDGIHLNFEGRFLYFELLSNCLFDPIKSLSK